MKDKTKINYAAITIGVFAFLGMLGDSLGFAPDIVTLINTTLQGLEVVASGVILFITNED